MVSISEKLAEDLRALGSSTTYNYDNPDASMLETFPNPMVPPTSNCVWDPTIVIRQPEFTSLCPKTGQPDFATIIIRYRPNKLCVESKSLKLYLGAFRMVGEFHEACVQRIANDLVKVLQPEWLSVKGEFTPRGGIPFWPEIQYFKPASLEPLHNAGD
jgi:7-cyano-7-deazaguanine reductase